MSPRTPTLACLCALIGCQRATPGEVETLGAPQPILTVLAVRDLEASLAFYTQAFGWPLRVDAPLFKELELPDGRGLGLYTREGFAHNLGGLEPTMAAAGTITATELYLHVPDLGRAIRALEAVGARELSGRAARPWGDEAAYYADPDGNVLVVAVPAPQSADEPAP